MLINADAFAGRVALVTGASRGIGAAVAKKLTEAGAFVVGTATSEKGAEAVSAALGEKGRGIVLNVTDRAACAEAVNAVVTEFGRIDILVNNAGITRDMLAMRLSDEDWDAVIATNLTSVFTMTRACLRPMIKARYGRIINMSSVVAQMGNAGQANYAAAKAGIPRHYRQLHHPGLCRNGYDQSPARRDPKSALRAYPCKALRANG